MSSGNKIIGQVHNNYDRPNNEHMNIQIYISSKVITQGLCGSFDRNRNNDLFNRRTNQTSGTIDDGGHIETQTSDSWR